MAFAGNTERAGPVFEHLFGPATPQSGELIDLIRFRLDLILFLRLAIPSAVNGTAERKAIK